MAGELSAQRVNKAEIAPIWCHHHDLRHNIDWDNHCLWAASGMYSWLIVFPEHIAQEGGDINNNTGVTITHFILGQVGTVSARWWLTPDSGIWPTLRRLISESTSVLFIHLLDESNEMIRLWVTLVQLRPTGGPKVYRVSHNLRMTRLRDVLWVDLCFNHQNMPVPVK